MGGNSRKLRYIFKTTEEEKRGKIARHATDIITRRTNRRLYGRLQKTVKLNEPLFLDGNNEKTTTVENENAKEKNSFGLL